MNYKKLFIFDADQFCLKNNISENELKKNYLIAASNDEQKLLINEHQYGGLVKSLPESTDTYLVTKLALFFLDHEAEKIIIATRDKKLSYMLLNLCITFKHLNVDFHPCCKLNINFDLSGFYSYFTKQNNTKKTLSKFELDVVKHLSTYSNGLKLKTLSLHYNLQQKQMDSIINRLVKLKYIYKHINAYHCK